MRNGSKDDYGWGWMGSSRLSTTLKRERRRKRERRKECTDLARARTYESPYIDLYAFNGVGKGKRE